MLLLQASLYTTIDTKTHLVNLIIQMIRSKRKEERNNNETKNIIKPSAAFTKLMQAFYLRWIRNNFNTRKKCTSILRESSEAEHGNKYASHQIFMRVSSATVAYGNIASSLGRQQNRGENKWNRK